MAPSSAWAWGGKAVGSEEIGQLWAVVIAGGDGTRVSMVTRTMTGEAVPKQYCSFGRDEPMIRWAMRRAGAVVPASRILVVVAEQHRRFWREMLADVPGDNLLVQPRNRGTAAGILLPALDIVLRRDHEARLVVMPADHYVGTEAVLRKALLAGVRSLERPDARLALLGMTGEDGDQEFGWIVPSAGSPAGLRSVEAFLEKPDAATSRELADRGALINSLIVACQGRALLRMYQESLPDLLRSFLPVVAAGSEPGAFARCTMRSRPGTSPEPFSNAACPRWRSSASLPAGGPTSVPPGDSNGSWKDRRGRAPRPSRLRALAPVRVPELGLRESLESQS